MGRSDLWLKMWLYFMQINVYAVQNYQKRLWLKLCIDIIFETFWIVIVCPNGYYGLDTHRHYIASKSTSAWVWQGIRMAHVSKQNVFQEWKKTDAKFDIKSDIKTCRSIIFYSKNKNMSFWPACLGSQMNKFWCETSSVFSKLMRTNSCGWFLFIIHENISIIQQLCSHYFFYFYNIFKINNHCLEC